ncbi:hypothetical protein [Pseudorhodoferax sp. Leaf265]|uniref:hypothetical protein n=1 Tax=Pseudorhodoferax sp. Leaf265 TaxID=1736315 RepID=UPI001F28A6DE|nr:hypothetical protein [Pseudorhodoferax sp. Leaf265]
MSDDVWHFVSWALLGFTVMAVPIGVAVHACVALSRSERMVYRRIWGDNYAHKLRPPKIKKRRRPCIFPTKRST